MVRLFFQRKPKGEREATSRLPELEPMPPAVYDPYLHGMDDVTPDALPGQPDLYAIVGVDPRASDDAIRYAYRRRASRLLDARWRPGRAARRLAELNAAYEILGKPDRRADYDRQRARAEAYERAQAAGFRQGPFANGAAGGPETFSPPEPGRDEGFGDGSFRDGAYAPTTTYVDGAFQPDAGYSGARSSDGPTLVSAAVTDARPIQPMPARAPRFAPPSGLRRAAVLAVAAALVVTLATVGWYAASGNAAAPFGMAAGIGPFRAATATSLPPAPTPTPRPVLVPQQSAPTATAVRPTATLPSKPTAVPQAAKPGPGAIGSQVRVTDQNPPRGSDVGVTVRLTRDGRPLPGVPVALRVYYRTVEERWPPGDGTVSTDQSGEATIVFNIGQATPGYEAQIVAVAAVEGGEPITLQTSFTPR